MIEQWKELKETITEMRDNGGTGTQQEVCRFLANYMGILEKQIQEPIIEMRDATKEERKSIKDYIESISKPTVVPFGAQLCKDCRYCKKWNKCPCGKEGLENGTSIGYSIGECKDYEPCENFINIETVIEWLKDQDIIKMKWQEENARKELAKLQCRNERR